MKRADALRLVEKLEALADPTRGGTDAERAVAGRKAERLRQKFGLAQHEGRSHAPPPRHFAAPRRGRAWSFDFDVTTGAAGNNVTVHHYRSPSDWRITIDP